METVSVSPDGKSLRYCQESRFQQSNLVTSVSALTWSQVLCVRDQVLHRLHHLCHCQVLQDAFAHTDYFANL